jgi:antibiotic biosynthesis monooxygenase (ABM) superfamily enzyme
MSKTRGTGLLMLWTDVDPEHEAEFNRWYNEEHIQHLLKVPGFLSAGRYSALSGGPKYLSMYELEEPSVLRTQAFLDEVRFRPSPWRTKTSGGHVGRNYILQAYRQIHPARTNPIELQMGPSPYLQMGRMDIPAHMEEEWNAWYNTVYIPDYLTVPGVIRARRFTVVEGQPKYLTVYEFERPDVPKSDAWNAVRDRNPWTHRIRPFMKLDAGSPAVFKRIHPDPV